jgi:protein-disulfide isomerase
MKMAFVAAGAVIMVGASGCHSEAKHSTHNPDHAPAVTADTKADWTQSVKPTPEGGFVMGNPAAPVHLVEYGSLTCPHCKAFNDEGTPKLISDYVKAGRISYEFRNYVRDPYDIAAALIARCDGPKDFFQLTDALYKDQPNWIAKVEAVSSKQEDQLASLPEGQQFLARARAAGLQQWAAAHNIPPAQSNRCLTNNAEVDRLVQMNADATDKYDIPGTPTFLIDGKVADDATTWDTLKPVLDAALVHR